MVVNMKRQDSAVHEHPDNRSALRGRLWRLLVVEAILLAAWIIPVLAGGGAYN